MQGKIIQKEATLLTLAYLILFLFERLFYSEFYFHSLITTNPSRFLLELGYDNIIKSILFISALSIIFHIRGFLKLEIVMLSITFLLFSILGELSNLTYHIDSHILKYLLTYLIVLKMNYYIPPKFIKLNLRLLILWTVISFLFAGVFKLLDLIDHRDFFYDTFQYTQFWDIWHIIVFIANRLNLSIFSSISGSCLLIFSSISLLTAKKINFTKYLFYFYGFLSLLILESYMALPLLIFIFLNMKIKQEIIDTKL